MNQFYHVETQPGLALLIPRVELEIISLACLTERSVDIFGASFLYSYLHLACLDLCSLCVEPTPFRSLVLVTPS